MQARVEAGTDPLELVTELRASARTISDLGDLEQCSELPAEGLPGLSNDRFYFLSEILQGEVPLGSPGCGDQLACFLKQVASSPHGNATLVIDRQCVVDRTLTMPSRFTLAGVGIAGEGVLVFDLPPSGTGIRFGSGPGTLNRLSAIRDLRISGTSCCGQTGIEVANSSLVDLERIRLSGFAIGLYGEVSYTVNVSQSHFFDNGFNVVLGDDTTTWHLRDSILVQSLFAGLVVGPTARGNLLSGGRVESNRFTGVLIHGTFNVVENTWFEGNGGASQFAVRLAGGATQNRLLANLYSSQLISDGGTGTQICFSMQFGASLDNC